MNLAQVLPPLAGGLLIGLSSAALLLLEGRIAGISGIVGRMFPPQAGEFAWRLWFVAGLLAGAVVLRVFTPGVFGAAPAASLGTLAVAGLLVGYGTRLANGCTSGHGVSGLSRRSPRSLAAVATFMGVAVGVVFVVRHLLPGGHA
ncbi:MAG: YeeE/YedE thiosulfate transporter family protein [Deltaproteobacteria bacterium]